MRGQVNMRDPMKNLARRKKCKTCQYRLDDIRRGCGFMYYTGKRRNCDAENCNKYIKGPKLTKRNNPAWSSESDYEY